MAKSLTKDEKTILLRAARAALEAAARNEKLPALDLQALPESLRAPGASFVTLSKEGALRGCIGALSAQVPLVEDVRQHAIDAARHDHRFFPVQPDETQSISIEISVLTRPEPLALSDPESILKALRPGVDGVVILSGNRRATFLPQVWEKVPSPAQFLGMLCQKAGLPDDAWRRGKVEIQVYQVESFHEESTEKPNL